MGARQPGQVVAHGKRRLAEIAEGVRLLVANVRWTIRAREEKLREARRLLRQVRDVDPQLAPDVAGHEIAPAIPVVDAVAGPEFVDDGVRPDARPAVRPGDGFGLAVERAEIHETGAAVAAGDLERERVGVAVLPAHTREQRVTRG